MSESSLEELGLSVKDAKTILNSKPELPGDIYWQKIIKAYFVRGKRKNALVVYGDTCRTSTRYNDELDDPFLFIPLSKIQEALEESAPF